MHQVQLELQATIRAAHAHKAACTSIVLLVLHNPSVLGHCGGFRNWSTCKHAVRAILHSPPPHQYGADPAQHLTATSRFTPHTSHRTPHPTPHTSHLTPPTPHIAYLVVSHMATGQGSDLDVHWWCQLMWPPPQNRTHLCRFERFFDPSVVDPCFVFGTHQVWL